MNRIGISPPVAALLLLAAIAASRVPFLDAGYGMNHDAWRVAAAARQIATTGQYEVSRFPGYPLHEIVCAAFRWGGPPALNALSAAFSLAAAAALWLIARQLRSRDAALIALAFAATPVFFINSVSSKDYVWAIALVLWSFYAAMNRRPVSAGVLFGLAIGCRLTSGAMLLPLALLVWGAQREWKSLGRFIVCGGVVALLAFSPVFARYGWSFLTFYHAHERPSFATMAARGTFEVWGAVGLIGLLAAAISILMRKWRDFPTSAPAPADNLVIPALGAWLLLSIITYLALPDQAGYLIPLIPPLLLILARLAARPVFQFACVCLLIAPWVQLSGGKVVAGPVLADQRARLTTIRDVQQFIVLTEQKLPPRTTVVVGAWQPIVDELFHGQALQNRYVYLLTSAEVEAAARSGTRLAYATEAIRGFNYRVHGIDLAAHGAVNVRRILVGAP
jgi:hypothetical protein